MAEFYVNFSTYLQEEFVLSRGAGEVLLLEQEVTVLMAEVYESALHCGQFSTQSSCCS